MVAPLWLLAVPMVTTTGTAPVPAPFGTMASICRTPVSSPGPEPAYATCAVWPPIVTETGNNGVARRSPTTNPSASTGSVIPSPVPNKTTTWPALAAFVLELTVPSALNATTAPEPVLLEVNRPGAEATTGTEKLAVVWLP